MKAVSTPLKENGLYDIGSVILDHRSLSYAGRTRIYWEKLYALIRDGPILLFVKNAQENVPRA